MRFCTCLIVLCTCTINTVLKYMQAISLFCSELKKKETNKSMIFYYLFNKKLYTCFNYYYKHIFKTCEAKNHRFKICKKTFNGSSRGT